MAGTENEIKDDFVAHIAKEGSQYKYWYVGITNDVERRLFIEHNIDKNNGWWIYRTANNSNIARNVEQYFINAGCDGGSGGGDTTSKLVYAYKKTSNTKP